MAYNPGIAARGEILGQSIGAAGQSIAQQYGDGLKLQEEQKRYNKEQKRLKKARRFIEDSNIKRAGILAEQIFDDEGTVTAFKETIEGWEAADVAGWIAGQTDSMKVKAQQGTIAVQGLQLQKLQDEYAQDPVMREAMASMTMYESEQNLSPMDALNSTVQQNPNLSWQNRLKLNQLVQARQTMDYNAQSLQLKGMASQVDRINAETNAGNAQLNQQIFDEGQARRGEGVKTYDIPGVEGSTVVQFPSGSGTRSQVVKTSGDDLEEDTTRTGGLTQVQVSKVVTQLKKLKTTGETHGTVTSKGVVKGSKMLTNDDPIDELIQKYELMQTGQPGEADVRRQAAEAIAAGADEAAVRRRVKEQYGIDL
jgi:hypothetical protein